MTRKTMRKLLAGAAIAGLGFGSAAARAHETGDKAVKEGAKASKEKMEKHCCKGQNSCKGKGGCGAEKGKNECKGKGGCSEMTKCAQESAKDERCKKA